MSGSIGVTSASGAGSSFWFEVPLLETAAPARFEEHSPMTITERRSHPARVLLAEDLEANQILVTAMLRKAGHMVDVVETGPAAVEAVQRVAYDLVLMDVHMPVMDGLEATRRIRALTGEVANIPIIALTASVLEQDVEACRAARMDDFIPKPVDRDTLLAALERWARPKTTSRADQSCEAPARPVILDDATLANVEELVGPARLEALVGSFLSDLEQRLAVMTASGADCRTIEREAHALVSLAGNVGVIELAGCSRNLIDACRRREGDVPQCVKEVNEAAERARAHLQEWQTRYGRVAGGQR